MTVSPPTIANKIIKFADDTMVVGLSGKDGELAYRDEGGLLSEWCRDNNLLLNTTKKKKERA